MKDHDLNELKPVPTGTVCREKVKRSNTVEDKREDFLFTSDCINKSRRCSSNSQLSITMINYVEFGKKATRYQSVLYIDKWCGGLAPLLAREKPSVHFKS
jgi:hypothetical protein